MKRQFKFRLWNVAAQEFIGEDEFAITAQGQVLLKLPDQWIPVTEEIKKFFLPIQYLGADCKSEDGNELCEGDIILDADGLIYTIKYDTELGCFYPDDYEYEMPFDWTSVKIIGNIYENPEKVPSC